MKMIKTLAGIFVITVIGLTGFGVLSVLTTESSNPSPLVQSAQIAGAGFSIVFSALLVILYAQQKDLLEEQTELQEKQADIQAASMAADVHFVKADFTSQNRLHFGLSNLGGGKAKNFKLIIDVEPSIGPKYALRYNLVRYQGNFRDKSILEANTAQEDMYLTIDDAPSVSGYNHNLISLFLIKQLDPDRHINLNLRIVYDDLVSNGKHVSKFNKSARIEIPEAYSDTPETPIEWWITWEFEDNLRKLLLHDQVVAELKGASNRMW